MVDIALDSRWGAGCESNGEDPFLSARIAEAMVKVIRETCHIRTI